MQPSKLGANREKPSAKKSFARVAETPYSYGDEEIRVIVKPQKENAVFNVSEAWFLSRVAGGALMDGLILDDKFLTVTFRPKSNTRSRDVSTDMAAWDSNERRLDGFNPTIETG